VFITGLEEELFPVSRSIDEPEALEEERRLFYVGLTRAEDKVYLLWAAQRRLYDDIRFRVQSRFLNEIDTETLKKSCTFQKSFRPEHRSSFQNNKIDFDTHPEYESFSQEPNPYRKGMRVHHKKYGDGQILNVEGSGMKSKVVVRFTTGDEKKFLLQYALFEVLE
jgi:DNA helicase-2/ATP-dependent DNA helicase PcrA